MLRRPVARAMRPGPGLVGTVARTAVVAGTATAVSGKVAQKQAAKAQAAAATQAPPPPAPAPVAAPPAAVPAAGGADLIEQLTQLGELRDKGILTEAEFEVQKQRLLA